MRFGPRPEGKSIKPRGFEGGDGRAQGRRRGLAEHEPGDAVLDRLGTAALAEDDRRAPAGERLERHDAGVLDARHQHRAAAAIELAQLGVGHVAQELDLGGGLGAQARGLGPGAHDPQAPAGAAIGLERELEALVGRERRDDEVVASRRVRRRE